MFMGMSAFRGWRTIPSMKSLWGVLSFVALMSSSGCFAPAAAPVNNGGNGGGNGYVSGGGRSAFVIKNQSAVTICYVNISPTQSSNWGPDRLGSRETIQPGQERGWSFDSGYYDFRLQDCNHRTIMERRSMAFEGRDGLVLTFRRPE